MFLKKILPVYCAFIFLVCFFVFAGCEVGLGSSVDTEAPVLSITYPPVSSVVRDYFVLCGMVKDDKSVESVRISVKNTDENKSYGLFTAVVEDTLWKCEFNKPIDGKYPFPDGKYTFDVVARDTSMRTSGVGSISLEIDNTAPLFVVSSPGVVELERAAAYGSVFKVSGSIAEAHAVSYMQLDIFDSSGSSEPIASWVQEDINIAGGTSETFARYNLKSADELHNRYMKIYGSNSGSVSFYASIKMYDSARLYQSPSFESDVKPDDEKYGYEGFAGNCTSKVWLNDDIYPEFLSKNSKIQLQISSLMRILNGTEKISKTLTKEKIDSVRTVLDKKVVDTSFGKSPLAFSLNKDANPTYDILGFAFLYPSSLSNKAAKLGKISLQMSAGLDGTLFNPAKFNLYLFGPYNSLNDEKLSAIYTSPSSVYENDTASLESALLWEGKTEYNSSSVSDFSKSISLPETIASGKFYVFAGSGTDEDGVDFVSASSFGFIGTAAGYPPEIFIASPADGVLTNSLSDLNIKGKAASAESNIEKVSYSIAVYDEADSSFLLGTLKGEASAADGEFDSLEENWTIDINSAQWVANSSVPIAEAKNPPSGKMYKYVLTITAYDVTALYSSYKSTINIDTLKPAYGRISIQPVAKTESLTGLYKKNYVNGLITLSGSVIEKNLKSVKLTIADEAVPPKVKVFDFGVSDSFSTDIMTEEFTDDNALIFTVSAEDNAGNVSSISVPGAGYSYRYHVLQSTDLPVISMSNAKKSIAFGDIKLNNNLYGITSNNVLTGTVTDDDGLNTVTITVCAEDGNELSESTNPKLSESGLKDEKGNPKSSFEYNCAASTSFGLNFKLPVKEAKYKIKISAKDLKYSSLETAVTVQEEFNIAIDSGIPELEIYTPNNTTAAVNSVKTITGYAYDSNGLKSLKCYDNKAGVLSNEREISVASDGSWTDTVNIEASSGMLRYAATDIYGNETVRDFKYLVDAVRPVIGAYKIPENITADNVINSANVYTIVGSVSDSDGASDGLDLSSVKYFVSENSSIAADTVGSDSVYRVDTGWENAQILAVLNSDNSHTWKVAIDLSSNTEKVHYVYIAAFDAAGNQSKVNSSVDRIKLTLDKTAPAISINPSSPNSGYVKAGEASSVSGTLQEKNLETFKVTYKLEKSTLSGLTASSGTTNISVLENNWSFALDDGNYTSIEFNASDKAGYESKKVISVNVDRTIPVIKKDASNPISEDWLNSGTQKINVLVTDTGDDGTKHSSGISNVYYILDGDTANPKSLALGGKRNALGTESGTLLYNLYYTAIDGLSDGNHTVKVYAEDNAGNKSGEILFNLKIDTSAPFISSVSIEESLKKRSKADLDSNNNVSINVNVLDSGSGIKKGQVIKNSGEIVHDTSDISLLKIPAGKISEGENNFIVRIYDAAGNYTDSSLLSVYGDYTLPSVSYTSHIKGALVNKRITFKGSVADANGLKPPVKGSTFIFEKRIVGTGPWYKVNSSDYGDVSIEPSTGIWTLRDFNTSSLVSGTTPESYELRARFMDSFGNISENEGIRLTINQLSDRPVIKLSNVNRTGSAIKLSKTVFGTISDDDGDVKRMWVISTSKYSPPRYPSIDNDNGWTRINVENGSGNWQCEAASEGKTSWYFYVIDAEDGHFYSMSSSAVDGLTIKGVSDVNPSDDWVYSNVHGVSFSSDMNAPEVELYISNKENPAEGDWTKSGMVFGGTNKTLSIRLDITEAVGISESYIPDVFIGGNKVSSVAVRSKTKNKPNYRYELSAINLSSFTLANGTSALTVKVADLSGQAGQASINLTIDNSSPNIQIISPTTNISDAVSSAITVRGLVQDDYSSIAKLQYLIPKKNVTYTGNSSEGWISMGAAASWEIAFASGAEDSSDSLLYYAAAKDGAGQNIYDITTVSEGVYKVPIYFNVTDYVGNTAVRKNNKSGTPLYVLVDVDAAKPKAWINSPENDSTTSGVVTIYGGASDNISVSSVRMQLDVNNDSIFDITDYNIINSWTSDTYVKPNLMGNPYDWYILCVGTNSWKRSINTDMIPLSAGGKKMRVRVRAYDEDGYTRDWNNPILITIDSNSPVIKNLRLVQYGVGNSSGTPLTEREYTSGVYISNNSVENRGKWYFKVDVSDNERISSITFEKLDAQGVNVISLSETNLSPNQSSYMMNLPLETENSGVIYSRIKVTDNTGNLSMVEVRINIDSTAPSMYNTNNAESTSGLNSNLRLKAHSAVIGNGVSDKTVENSNNYFTFGDVVSENGSGLAYIAFYLQRDGAAKRVYNPMFGINNRTNLVDIKTPNKVYINQDGLAALYVEGLTRKGEDSFTSASLVNNNNIRRGGLVKIAGIYSLITSYNPSTGTVSISPTASTSFTKAEIIYAQVVNHQLTETINDDKSIQNDDGDGMCETINNIGASYIWTASVNSLHIPDGPVSIKVVAIDNAGNITSGSVPTSITNNRPRITKVMLATDLNGSGKYDFKADKNPITSIDPDKATANGKSFGEFSYYSAINKNTGVAQYNVKLDSDTFKVVSGLCILPEFTGGNNSLKYILSVKSYDDETNMAGTPVVPMTTKSALIAKMQNKGTKYIAEQISDFGGIEIPSSLPSVNGNGLKYFIITFWDETEETVPGVSSQWAHLRIPVMLASTETNIPVAKINPFYWNSAVDNSVYINNALRGHIELENDIVYSTIASKTGMKNTSPKVSGIIKVEGTVKDDTRLREISLDFSEIFPNTKFASYSDGCWINSPLPSAVQSFSVEDLDISQDGHIAKWVMVVNTEAFSGIVGKSKKIKVSAKDWKGNTFTAGNIQTTITSQTGFYEVDIVPYITELLTPLSAFNGSAHSVFARTAQGKYSVAEGTTIAVLGYNLGSNIASVTIPGQGNVTLSTGNVSGISYNNTFKLNSSAESGDLSLYVNSVPALNNFNSNYAKGDFEETFEDEYILYKNWYNRQPNNVNNNRLNDDTAIDVWQFKNAVIPINGAAEYVTMKINPKTGIPGFSFANSILYFNMPGYQSDANDAYAWGANNTGVSGQQYSTIPFGMNYGGFSHNTFAYDSYGYSYGAAMCTDTQSAKASAFFQFFSRETPLNPIDMDQNMNYVNCANASRLDSSTVQIKSGNGGWVTNINRILSPSMETTYSGGSFAPTSGTPVYIYMAYYDDSAKQVRFRWGTVGGATDNIDGKENSTSASYANSMGLDDIVESRYTGFAQGSKNNGNLRPANVQDSLIKYPAGVQVVASTGISDAISYYSSSTPNKAGQYVSLSIVNKDTVNPVAIVTWYDSVNRKLVMAYNTNPVYSNVWISRVIDPTGGLNVKTVVDGNGGIHFAYYDSINGSNLKYAYLSSYNSVSAPVVVDVDNYGAVGAKCTIDVAKIGTNWVPYITYQNNGYLGTPIAAKIAYRTDFVSATYEGSDKKDFMTGKWEISVIPSVNIPKDDTINVGLWKDAFGYAKQFTTNYNWTFGDSGVGSVVSNNTLNVCAPTIVKGNNTANPIVGYGIDTGAIEMAQKK